MSERKNEQFALSHFFKDRPERFAHGRSFVKSELLPSVFKIRLVNFPKDGIFRKMEFSERWNFAPRMIKCECFTFESFCPVSIVLPLGLKAFRDL